jgi:CRP/FNR family transcriptional regulator
MLNLRDLEALLDATPPLRNSDAALRRALSQAAFLARIPAGQDVFTVGQRADALAILVSGTVRVYQIGANGREITLYRFGSGESCMLTANAIINRAPFPAIATVTQDATAALVPADAALEWMTQYPAWRNFVLNLYSARLSQMMQLVDEVAFRRMDERVAELILARAGATNQVAITHQQVASELGSSREVISRILEGFASGGILRVQRGTIEILDANALRLKTAV